MCTRLFFAALMRRHPRLHRRGHVRPQAIHDQEHLSRRALQQPTQEHHEQRRGPRLRVGHKPNLALVRDRRDLVRSDVGIGHLLPRGFPLRGIAPRRLLVRRHADLVTPVDFGAFLLGPGLDGGVRFPQPLPHLVGVLIPSMAARPLEGEAPPPQIPADGPLRQIEVEFLADQLADGTAGPQRRRDAQSLGLMRAQEALQEIGLRVGEDPARTHGASGAALWQGEYAVVGVGGPPATDGLAGDAEEFGDLDFGESQLTAAQGTQPERFQNFIG